MTTGTTLTSSQYVISDGIVVWRAWIMFQHNLLVKFILSVCMVCSCSKGSTGNLVGD